jgi:hypothetical protein
MELAVILVLLVIVELALTFYLLGRLKDYRKTVNELVDHMANVEHGLDRALESLDLADENLRNVVNDRNDSPSADILAAAEVAQNATPAEIEQAKSILTALGVKLED